MAHSFHESYAAGEVKPPSDRSVGFVFTAVALIVAVLWRHNLTVALAALVCAGMLAALSFAAPALLRPLNVVWFKFGLLLHKIVNPVVMLALFAVVFVPAGALMRLWHDPLRKRRGNVASYWIDRTAREGPPGSMTNQF
jgi:hypothetical protein